MRRASGVCTLPPRRRAPRFPTCRRCPAAAPPTSSRSGCESSPSTSSLSYASSSRRHPADALRHPRALSRAWSSVLLPLPVSCSSAARYNKSACCTSRRICPKRPGHRPIAPVESCSEASPEPDAACRSAPWCARPPCSDDRHLESPAHRSRETPESATQESPAHASPAAPSPRAVPAESRAGAATEPAPPQDASTAEAAHSPSAPRSRGPACNPSAPSPQTTAAPHPDHAPDRPPSPPTALRIAAPRLRLTVPNR